ncbi:MAG: hypothetical protein AVDCRST_MAG01-01-4074 [uncultured Rubrobacteraceae bacterium]|uniref:Uncharacterized protein n=1 Tax=uncultured Rubrobacteraceae bacterium TaxID=349277 RepID=A0A6J4QM27_9ACTN|nr:MAG: hypothetical protein AVDCRST_MAG01-01-4074 [uncultured Rubrobacteraceae bacterium]
MVLAPPQRASGKPLGAKLRKGFYAVRGTGETAPKPAQPMGGATVGRKTGR